MIPCVADVAQLVEHDLAKVGVAGSNPVVRSICQFGPVNFSVCLAGPFFETGGFGDVAKW